MARIWVTGAHGFIGRHLTRHLAQLGHKVAGIGHGTWSEGCAAKWGVHFWMAGNIESASLKLLQRDFGTPEIIFHLAGGASVGAAIAKPHEDFSRTVISTSELFEWVRQYAPQVYLVAVSSAAVYGAGHIGAIAETATLNPFSPYGFHKRMMEDICRVYASNYELKVSLARLFSVYGAGLKKQLLWDLCTQLSKNPTKIQLGGTGGELRDWTHVNDVVCALDKIAPLASTQMPIFNIGTSTGTTVREIAQQIMVHWYAKMEKPSLIFNGQSRRGDPFSLIASSKLLTQLGSQYSCDLNEGLGEYVSWYRKLHQELR